MRAQIVKMGNSQGLRIPKVILEQCHLEKEVELEVRDNILIITPAKTVRQGWDEAFSEMAKQGDDSLLDEDTLETDWEKTEWEWK